jgi:hypothetical protein
MRYLEQTIPRPKGALYEVDINADPEHFLDWDKPLQEQPAYERLRTHWDEKLGDPDIIAERLGIGPSTTGAELHHGIGGFSSQRNEAAHKALSEAGIPGIKYLDQGSRDPAKMKELADDLAQYREAAKHWAATGDDAKLATVNKQIEVLEKRLTSTRNYVVFDDKLISIVKKNGIAAALAAGLITESQAAEMRQQGYDE